MSVKKGSIENNVPADAKDGVPHYVVFAAAECKSMTKDLVKAVNQARKSSKALGGGKFYVLEVKASVENKG